MSDLLGDRGIGRFEQSLRVVDRTIDGARDVADVEVLERGEQQRDAGHDGDGFEAPRRADLIGRTRRGVGDGVDGDGPPEIEEELVEGAADVGAGVEIAGIGHDGLQRLDHVGIPALLASRQGSRKSAQLREMRGDRL